ncbi:MAG: alpha/beta hydrolase [Microthrixaceae bacterium]|nr:alpha/beta hydrolase [Microthrixaceae bacterium]
MPELPSMQVRRTGTRSTTNRPHLRFAALVAALLMVAAACTTGEVIADAPSNERGEAPLSRTEDPGELDWGGCQQELAAMARLECATLAVPMDRADESSRNIELELARSPATGDPDERIGSLLFNPGGPGGSGIEFLANAAFLVPDELQERFDLVSWDPRGVGESTPVRCLTDEQKDAHIEGDLSPDDDEELQRAIDNQAEFLEGCLTNHPDLIQHMSTADVAGDLEEIREALGDDQLNYVGFSYGTAIGATYATMFPDKVRAMVLDGAVAPGADDLDQTVAQMEGFERTYLSFVAECDSDPDCALHGDTAGRVEEVRTSLDTDPIEVRTTSGTRELTRDLFDTGLLTALYDPATWGLAADAIADLESGGGATMLTFADQQVGRNPDGTWNNSGDAQAMVSCADTEVRPTLEEAEAQIPEVAESVPTFGEAAMTAPLSCVDWPLAANPVPEWTAAGAPPILVVGTVGDPATPYEWAEQMTAALEGSVLLTYEGDGHTAFMRGAPCIDDAVVAYLVDLEVPAAGTSCEAVESDSGLGGIEDLLLEQFSQAGIPQSLAECITGRLRDELGDADLGELLLGGDPNALNELVTDITLECMAEG